MNIRYSVSNLINGMRTRLELIRLGVKYAWFNDTAYPLDGITNLITTITYSLVGLGLFNILYQHFHTIGSYSENDMRFFLLVSHAAYFLNSLTYYNMLDLDQYINEGGLDTILTKPIPSLFFIVHRRISLFTMLLDGLPAVIVNSLFVNFNLINFTFGNLLSGVVALGMGLFILQTFHFLAIISATWTGRSRQASGLAYAVDQAISGKIPYDVMNRNMRLFLITILPVMVTGPVATSIFLGKGNSAHLISILSITFVIAILLRHLAWTSALRRYSSASS